METRPFSPRRLGPGNEAKAEAEGEAMNDLACYLSKLIELLGNQESSMLEKALKTALHKVL